MKFNDKTKNKKILKKHNIFRLTKEASKKKNVSHTEALLDEWSTSGRIRPTIKHFYDLLINVPLYRAADYIADELLDISLPIRPSDGPAKQIDIKIPAAKIKDNLSDCLKLGIQNVKNAKPTELEDAGPSFIPKLPNFDRLGKSESDCIEEANECMERNEIKRNNPTLTEWKHEIQNVKIAKPFESFAYKVPDFDRLGTSESQ